MKKIDLLSLDGRALYMIKLIYELRSVTAAANQLGVTQSSVSHALERMRGLLGDPLFIKSGRNMVPTARTEQMMGEIEAVLSGLQALFNQAAFDPHKANERFSIASNDFEHDLIVPAIFAKLRSDAPNCTLRTYQYNAAGQAFLEKGVADIKIAPYPPTDTDDLVVTPLISDHFITYYDPEMREAPKDAADFAQSSHATLAVSRDERTHVDDALDELGLTRRVAYLGPNFNAIAMAVRGTDMLATAPSRMACTTFRDFKWVRPPFHLDPVEFYMIWHVRNRHSPRHKWFRNLVKQVAQSLPTISVPCATIADADTQTPE